jgi:hypothetical protein
MVFPVQCHHGMRSLQAANWLKSQVHNLKSCNYFHQASALKFHIQPICLAVTVRMVAVLRACHFRLQGFTRLYNISGGIHAYSVKVDDSIPKYWCTSAFYVVPNIEVRIFCLLNLLLMLERLLCKGFPNRISVVTNRCNRETAIPSVGFGAGEQWQHVTHLSQVLCRYEVSFYIGNSIK